MVLEIRFIRVEFASWHFFGVFLSHFICIHIKPCLSPIESDHPPWDQMVTLQSFRSSSQWSKILFQVAPAISRKSRNHCNIVFGFWWDIFFQAWILFESNHPPWDQMVTPLQSFRSSSQWSRIIFQVAPAIARKSCSHCLWLLIRYICFKCQVWIQFESNHTPWDQMVTLQSFRSCSQGVNFFFKSHLQFQENLVAAVI